MGQRLTWMRGVLSALLAAGVVAASVPAQSGAAMSTTIDPYRARGGPIFGAPSLTPETNQTLVRVLDNINHTPPGARIRIVAFSLNLHPVADALIAAGARGVSVQLVLNGHNRQFPAVRRLVTAFGKDRTQSSYVWLTSGGARDVADGELHQKTWMFSQTGQSTKVVMVGSMNLTEYGTTKQYSDTFAFVDRDDIWTLFNTVFEQQAADVPGPTPTTKNLGDVTAWFGPGFSRLDDPVMTALSKVRPDKADIRIGAFAWWDKRGARLAEQVISLQRGGADVDILTGIHVSRAIKSQLRKGGLAYHRGAFAGGDNIHLKMVLVRDRARDRRFVLTGSDNWSNTSYAKDDLDIVIPLNKSQYRRYVDYFDSIVARSVAEYGEPGAGLRR